MKRYKHIVQVILGEHKGAGVKSGVRCLWDSETDGYTSDTFSNVSFNFFLQFMGPVKPFYGHRFNFFCFRTLYFVSLLSTPSICIDLSFSKQLEHILNNFIQRNFNQP